MSEKYTDRETKMFSLAELHGSQKTSGLYFTLIVIEGSDFGLVFQINLSQSVIGRKEEGGNKPDIEINDDRASRRHLIIYKKKGIEGDALSIMDLGSKNGTYLNGQRLGQMEVVLNNNDKIQIGGTVLKYEVKDTFDVSFQERLYKQVTRDALTELWNYSYAKQELERILSLAYKSKLIFSLALLEIDNLNTITDAYGRSVSDSLLRTIAQRIVGQLSTDEVAARTSDNQILIIMPEVNIDTAFNLAERLRESIEDYDFSSLGVQQRITLSGSVAQYPISGASSQELLTKLEEVLYRSRQVAPNRISKVSSTELKNTNILKKVVAIAGLVIVLVLVGVAINSNLEQLSSLVKADPTKEQLLIYSGTAETHDIQVGSRIGGRVREVLVKEGQSIKKADVLVRVDVSELLAREKLLKAKIAESEANLAKLIYGFRLEEREQADALVRKEKARLDELRSGFRPQEIAQAKANLLEAESNLSNLELTFERINKVYSRGYESKQQKDDAENNVRLAKARVEALRQRLLLLEEGTRKEEILAAEERYKEAQAGAKLLNTGSRTEDISAARAQLAAVQAELEELKVRIAEGEVLSPTDCLVEAIDIRPGDILTPGQPVAKLLEQDQIWVRVYVPHTDMGYIKLMQKASIIIDSFPGVKFSGYVEKIDEQSQFYPRNVQSRTDREHQVFGIKVHIDNKDGKIKSGMSADVILDK